MVNNFEIENICIILQGYPVCEEQLVNDIINYNKIGVKYFIVSTYENKAHNLYEKLKDINIDLFFFYNNNIGNIKHFDSNNVCFSFDESEIIDGLHIDYWNWLDFKDHWAEKSTFKQYITTRRGISLANIKFPNCSHYFVIRGDMTINNMLEILNKLKTADLKIIDDIAKEKIVVKYNDEHRYVYNITTYFFFGNKHDINNFFNVNRFVGPSRWEKGHPERLAMNAYMCQINKLNIPKKQQYELFFHHEKEFNVSWPKYNLYGIWG